MDISFVVAVAENGVIGINNELPWRLSSDLKRFRQLTMGKPIVMGRKTFESIGKPLDGRANIIISRDPEYRVEGAYVVHSIEEALELGETQAKKTDASEIMVIGGAEIYKLMLPHATRIFYTLVHASPEGDALFPKLDFKIWFERSCEVVKAGPKDSSDFSVILYER